MRSQWDQFGWRERWVFPRNALEGRAPFCDVRVIELLASTPDWVKRHNGRTKDVLRAAEYRVLPLQIPDRVDKAVYDELFHRGLTQETERVEAALGAIERVPGLRVAEAQREVRQYIASPHMWVWGVWRLLSVGLWLSMLDGWRPARSDSSSLQVERADEWAAQ